MRVLWVSRHYPLPAQIRELQRIYGADVEIVQMQGNIPNAEVIVQKAKEVGAKVIVPVLPLSMIARLAEVQKKEGFILLFAKMNAIASVKNPEEAKRIVMEAPEKRTITTYSDGVARVFEFERFEKIIEVKLVTEAL
jgi:16S rRNA U1498 N3-methylase RsmE